MMTRNRQGWAAPASLPPKSETTHPAVLSSSDELPDRIRMSTIFTRSNGLQSLALEWRSIVAQEVFDADFCAERLKALSDPHRLKIVNALRYGELTVGDIAELLDAEVVTVSHHLKIMKYANLVEVRREGRYMYYKLHDDLQCTKGKGTRFLDLGCCRLEVPDKK